MRLCVWTLCYFQTEARIHLIPSSPGERSINSFLLRCYELYALFITIIIMENNIQLFGEFGKWDT